MQHGKTVLFDTIGIHIGIIYEKMSHMDEGQAETFNNFSIIMINYNNNIRIS